MTVVLSEDQQLEHTAEEAEEAGCTLCAGSLHFPYAFYAMERKVYVCTECCTNVEGITVDMFHVRREERLESARIRYRRKQARLLGLRVI